MKTLFFQVVLATVYIILIIPPCQIAAQAQAEYRSTLSQEDLIESNSGNLIKVH